MQTNVYRALLDILPQTPLQVATVLAVNTDGTRTIALPGGSQIRARGNASTGDRVFIRAGLIEGPAPTLPLISIDV